MHNPAEISRDVEPSFQKNQGEKNSVTDFKHFLRQVAELPEIHAKFLNTLSFLEYMGSRKILKSQRAESISLEILSHAAEEIRHAQVFKKMALKLSHGKLETYEEEQLFCGPEACLYFQTLDRTCAAALKTPDPWTNYLLTTLFIEERANAAYPYYDEILSQAGFPGVLKGIVREESNHLRDIYSQIEQRQTLTPHFLENLREAEDQAFVGFLNRLQAVLKQHTLQTNV